MAVRKNKHLMKDAKKGARKKVVGPFSRKDCHDVKAPLCANKKYWKKTSHKNSRN